MLWQASNGCSVDIAAAEASPQQKPDYSRVQFMCSPTPSQVIGLCCCMMWFRGWMVWLCSVGMSVRELKAEITRQGLDMSSCVEKLDLVQLLDSRYN